MNPLQVPQQGPHGERCPYPETFLTYIPGSPVKKLTLRPPPQRLFKERCSIPRAPFIQLSKSQVDKPSSRFPKQGPYHNRLTWYWLSHSHWCATYGSSVIEISRYSLPMTEWWIWLIILITCAKHHYKSHKGVLAGQMCHECQRCAGYIFVTFTQVLGIMIPCNDTVVMGRLVSDTGLLDIIY